MRTFGFYDFDELDARLARIERLLWLNRRATLKEEELQMASQQTLDALTAKVKANTDATQSAALALTGFVATVADLTAQLKAAIANDDDAAIKDVTAKLDANNATLTAAIPAVAAAVPANT